MSFDARKVPHGWEIVTVGGIADSIQYGHTASAVDRETGPRFLRITDIQDGQVHWESVPSCNLTEAELPKYQLKPGDLVFARTGATTGKSFLIRHCPDAVFASYLIRVRVSREMDERFLALFFQSPEYWRQIEGGKRGVGQPNVNGTILGQVQFILPPLAEQLRIVAKIEELFSELDAGVANLKKARAQLAVYRQALLKHAFEGMLTAEWRSLHQPVATVHSEIPHPVESWRFTTLGNLTEYITSGSRGWAEYYADSGPIFIRAANLNRDRLDLSEVAFVSLPAGVEGTRTQTRCGDVFVTITGANVTKAGYLDREIGESYVSQHVALCRPIDPTISEYLYLYIISNAGGRRDLEKAAYGAGKPGLNLDNLRTLQIPMPTCAEMPEIVAAIRSQLSEIDALEADIDQNLQRAEALRQSILKKAFAGELVPQDPADEPAAALLARIRAEREARAGAAAVAKSGKPRKIKVP